MADTSVRNTIIVIGILIISFVTGGILATKFLGGRHFLAIAVSAVGVVSFFGFLRVCGRPGQIWSITDQSIRIAITVAVVSVYLVLVAMGVFFTADQGDLPEIADTLLTSFTTIVGIVVAFYFGSSAYIEARTGASSKSAQNAEEKTA